MLLTSVLVAVAFVIYLVAMELKKQNEISIKAYELKKEELSLLKEQTDSLGFISRTLFEASTMQISELSDIASALNAIDHTQKIKMKTALKNRI